MGFLQPLIGWSQPVITLDQWPARLQLYPRDQTNQCSVAIRGRVPVDDVKAVSLVVYRNQQRDQYTLQSVDSLTGRFAFNPLIRAELSEWGFQLFAHRRATMDSVQVAFRDSIVCGDVFLIMGQSNAAGIINTNAYQNEFCRTFGVNKGDVSYNPADTSWCLINTAEGSGSGRWGTELQKLINEQYGIPTAILNGAVGSTAITSHVVRDSNQPANIQNLYGRLLYRARKAGVADQARALIWWQGEAEAANNPSIYINTFPQLYRYWKQDYPGLKKVYHAQLNLLTNLVLQAGALRDFQRRSKEIFNDSEPVATVGLADYQGVHYGETGYQQFGQELFRLVARDFYGSTDTTNIQSPNLRRLFYSTPQQDEITLEFEPGQVIHWPADTTVTNPANGYSYTRSLLNYLYVDYPNNIQPIVRSVAEAGNQLILTLTKPVKARHLTYLPSFYKDAEIGYFVGPFIRNGRGMRAFTFYQQPIAAPLPVATDLQAIPIDTSVIALRWSTTAANVNQWAIERADTTGQFKQIAQVPGTATAYDDPRLTDAADSLRIGKIYKYRIRSINQQAEADYSPVVSAALEIPDPSLLSANAARIYPNPASDQVRVQLPLSWKGDTVLFSLLNDKGETVRSQTSWVITSAALLPFSVANLPTGLYILKMQVGTNTVRRRLLISH